MPSFRKKPVIVEAEQWPGPPNKTTKGVKFEEGEYFVVTIHGQKTNIVADDWIIREPDGKHYYPCKPDVFKDIYEPVPPPS